MRTDPPAIELRHLRYFVTVAELRSFTRAGELLHVSQPTLSHQIKKLETMLGAVLFDRSARRAELTEAGRVFKPYCEGALKGLNDGLQAISDLEGLVRGNLRMGVFHSFSSSLLGPVVAEFALRYPGVRVVARLLPRSVMERDLISGSLDLAVAYASEDTENIVAEKLFSEELVLIVGKDHPLAKRSRIEMRELADLDLVLLTDEFAARQFLDKFFALEKVVPRIVLEMNAIEPILSTIRKSSLATVLSAGVIGQQTGFRLVRLMKPTPERTCAILWRRSGYRSAAARQMAEMIRAAYGTAGKIMPRSVRSID